MNRVNLNALRVFAVAAAHGNLQRAADALNLSRGAVSQRIKQLEIDLGVVLLARGARGVSLTPDGERCRAAVDDALAILDTALQSLGQDDNRITLHLGSSTAAKWLMPRMTAFARAFPDVSLTTEVHEQMLPRNLGRNEVAIWPGRALDKNPAHASRRLADLELHAVCSPGLRPSDPPTSIEALLTLPLLQDAHRRWDALIRDSRHVCAPTVLNFDRAALALDAAVGGHGVAIAPFYMIDSDVRSNRLVSVWSFGNPGNDGVFVSWSKDHMGQKRIQRIVDWIASEFGKDPAS